MKQTKVGLIGYGAIGSSLHRLLDQHAPHLNVVAALVPANERTAVAARAGGKVRIEDNWPAFNAAEPEIVVECAGHGALGAYGVLALKSGRHLVVSSVGALADQNIETALRDAASSTGSRLVIPSGAVGGLDALAAARQAGIDEVIYTSRKRPISWGGTAAERMIDLTRVNEPTAFFQGTAREAALTFPQNANVVAAIALAGIGFDLTRVTLMADPSVGGNQHTIAARGPFGEISSAVLTHTLPGNPKTSMLAPFSIMRAMTNIVGPFVL